MSLKIVQHNTDDQPTVALLADGTAHVYGWVALLEGDAASAYVVERHDMATAEHFGVDLDVAEACEDCGGQIAPDADNDWMHVVRDNAGFILAFQLEHLACDYPNCHAPAAMVVAGKRLCSEHGHDFADFLEVT